MFAHCAGKLISRLPSIQGESEGATPSLRSYTNSTGVALCLISSLAILKTQA
jgi:hypothetical protein